MNGKPFFDTTILIYSISSQDPRSTVAENLLVAGGYISVQVLNEFAAVARRKLNMSWEEISDALSAIRVLCEPPIALSVNIHEAAMKVAAQYGYHIYDALIVAAALEQDCDLLYSEDMQNGQRFGALTIRNPFHGADVAT
ncbi:MAG: PIN domain-containing protein [Acidobacteriaceae bacterium]